MFLELSAHVRNATLSLQTCYLLLGIIIVSCSDGDIRITGGDSLSYGRVEVCVSNIWRTVCGDQLWDSVDASVVCRQLGLSLDGMFLCILIILPRYYSIYYL